MLYIPVGRMLMLLPQSTPPLMAMGDLRAVPGISSEEEKIAALSQLTAHSSWAVRSHY